MKLGREERRGCWMGFMVGALAGRPTTVDPPTTARWAAELADAACKELESRIQPHEITGESFVLRGE